MVSATFRQILTEDKCREASPPKRESVGFFVLGCFDGTRTTSLSKYNEEQQYIRSELKEQAKAEWDGSVQMNVLRTL
jgi:hypothetical protein